MSLPFYKLRCALLEKLYELTVRIYQKIFKRNSRGWSTTMQDLQLCPEYSLGHNLHQFLITNNFVMQEKLESHDVFHVITRTGVSVPEEISMQFLLIANGKKSVYGFTTTILGFLIIPEGVKLYKEAFILGKKLQPFHAINFENSLHKPLAEIQHGIYAFNKENVKASFLTTTI